MVMHFAVDGNHVQITGDPSLSSTPISSQALLRLQDVEFGLLLWNVSTIEDNTIVGNSNILPPELQQLLNEFSLVFAEPSGLPPQRTTDHHIPLKEGVTAISCRPYRYSHLQKDEIERLVADMLATGVIQPSNSPFSSPVLLV